MSGSFDLDGDGNVLFVAAGVAGAAAADTALTAAAAVSAVLIVLVVMALQWAWYYLAYQGGQKTVMWICASNNRKNWLFSYLLRAISHYMSLLWQRQLGISSPLTHYLIASTACCLSVVSAAMSAWVLVIKCEYPDYLPHIHWNHRASLVASGMFGCRGCAYCNRCFMRFRVYGCLFTSGKVTLVLVGQMCSPALIHIFCWAQTVATLAVGAWHQYSKLCWFCDQIKQCSICFLPWPS